MDPVDEVLECRVASLLKAGSAIKFIKEDNVPCEIEEGLFLGSVGAANNKSALKSLNVTHILTVAHSLEAAHPNDFTYKIIKVWDEVDTKISQYFDECFDFINEAKRLGGGVLVHCFGGISRSATIVVAYLMKERHMSLPQALTHVRSRRPQASPNSGFTTQLRQLDLHLQSGAGMSGEQT